MKYLLIILLLTSIVLADCSKNQIDINSADEEELDEIIWVGEATAEKIINARPFESIDDLDKISGIGESKLQDIIEEGLACVEEEVEEDDKDYERVENFIEKEYSVVEPEMVLLNSEFEEEREEEIVYESKDSVVSRYLPYAFSFFLIVVIAILLLQRF